jgi:hypothetical protein
MQVVVFYCAEQDWPEGFYHGRVVSVEPPPYWGSKRLLQRSTEVKFECSQEVRTLAADSLLCGVLSGEF